MKSPEKKSNPDPGQRRPHRTGEDLDMLNETKLDPESGEAASSHYKDDIDGA
jgi:hypothetical protein